MIKPLGTKIYIQVEKQTHIGTIELPESAEVVLEQAKVLAVGEDVKSVKKGNKVLFKSWALDIATVRDEDYVFIDEKDILAIT